jgi:hypothetical protein
VPPVRIRVAPDLDLHNGAAYPGRLSLAYQAKNGFNRFSFVANASLALIVCQAVQTTGIQITYPDCSGKSLHIAHLPSNERDFYIFIQIHFLPAQIDYVLGTSQERFHLIGRLAE